MNQTTDPTPMSRSLTFEALRHLANNPLIAEPNKPEQMETYANDLTTNIIKDASRVASENHHENFNNTNELNFLQTSKQTPTDDTITTNNDFDYEDIQKKMNDVIQEIRPQSGDDTNIQQKSVTSDHHEQRNNSTPTIDSSTQQNPASNNLTDGPVRSLSESALVDHHLSSEQPLLVQQNESSLPSSSDDDNLYGIQSAPISTSANIDEHQSDQDNHRNNPLDTDHDFLNMKTGTIDDNQRSSSVIKQNDLDETTPLRIPSATSKQSTHTAVDEPTASGDEQHIQTNLSKFSDHDNQNETSATLGNISPVNRPRSPTPNGSPKLSIHSQINEKNTTDTLVLSTDHQRDDELSPPIYQSTTDISSPTSPRNGTDRNDEQHTSRPNSNQINHLITAEKQLKRMKSSEQLLIPTNDFDNERSNSPPPSPAAAAAAGIKSMVLFNPLLRDNLNEKEPEQSRSPSPRTSAISNKKIIHEDVRSSNSPRESNSSQQPLNINDQKPISRHGSQVIEQTSSTPSNRRMSSSQQQDELHKEQERQLASRRASKTSQESTSHRENDGLRQKTSSRKDSATSQQQGHSKSESFALEQQTSSRRDSVGDEQRIVSRKDSTKSEQQASSKRGSLAAKPQVSSRRESHTSEQQSSDREPNLPDNTEQNSSSPRRSSVVHVSSSQESSRRNSSTKHEQQSIPITTNKDGRRSSLTILHNNHHQTKHESNLSSEPIRTSTNNNREHTSSTDQDTKHRSSLERRSEQQTKRNSNLTTDKTIVTPFIIDSSNVRHHHGKHTSTTDSDVDQKSTSKLPSVNSSVQQEKSRRPEVSNRRQRPISNRSETKYISSSHPTTPSEDERSSHWVKHTIIPPIHLSDEDTLTPRNEQSPKVEQRPEYHQRTKKRNGSGERKIKEEQRRLSASSSTHIHLVDGRSLDSTSENNTDLSRHNQRNVKPKKKDAQTNTDHAIDSPRKQQQHSSSDEQELTPRKPLKATKPMSDHLHLTRRHPSQKEQLSTTSDRTTPTVQRTVKRSKESNQNKDPVNVNITVVLKKGVDDESLHPATSELFVEQNSQPYFEPVQHVPTNTRDERNEYHDRQTQSDTEQLISEKQKKHRRPKRISRTCQTYECVFRRMEREQHQALRATSNTEKNIQTRKSQLRSRTKSPKKYLSPYLSADSYRIEEILRKQYHSSRRNLTKSSSFGRSVSPQGGKLVILRPILPFHHTDAVDVQRVCLQYAIDLIPHSSSSAQKAKLTVVKQPEQSNRSRTKSVLPLASNVAPTSNKTDEHKHHRTTNDTV